MHSVFLYWFSSMGVDYKAQKRSLLSSSSNFNARWSMNYRIVTHIAGDGSWNTYLLPVNCGWRIWSFWSTTKFHSQSSYAFFSPAAIDSSHMFFTLFQRMVRAAIGCVITGEIDPTWLIALPHWDAVKRSETSYVFNILQTVSLRLGTSRWF